jgi:hypothetical protein
MTSATPSSQSGAKRVDLSAGQQPDRRVTRTGEVAAGGRGHALGDGLRRQLGQARVEVGPPGLGPPAGDADSRISCASYANWVVVSPTVAEGGDDRRGIGQGEAVAAGVQDGRRPTGAVEGVRGMSRSGQLPAGRGAGQVGAHAGRAGVGPAAGRDVDDLRVVLGPHRHGGLARGRRDDADVVGPRPAAYRCTRRCRWRRQPPARPGRRWWGTARCRRSSRPAARRGRRAGRWWCALWPSPTGRRRTGCRWGR